MKVYLSGQISGLKTCEYRNNFFQVEKSFWLKFKDVEVINPLDLKPFLGFKCWFCYMIIDLYYLRKCTHISMQSNWINSRGAHWEHYFAKFIFKLEVIYL